MAAAEPVLAARSRSLTTRSSATFALCGGWLVCFAAYFLDTGGVPYFRDLSRLYIPVAYYLHGSLLSGHLPAWFPYELLGTPFIGQIVTATFHPQTLIFLPFTPLTAVKLNIACDYLFGAAGAYRFARSLPTSRPAALLGAAAFTLGGYAVSLHSNPPYLLGMMTLAWVGWAALRLARRERWRDAGLLAIAWALVLLGGDVQGTGFAAVLVAATLAAEVRSARPVQLAVCAAAIAVLISCVELLPALVVFKNTFRLATTNPEAAASVWAMHPWRLVELVVPGFIREAYVGRMSSELFGDRTGALWATTLFTGGVALSFAAAGVTRSRRALSFAGLAVVALWMSLGVHGGLMPVTFRILPLLARYAYPEKYLALTMVCLVPLVALGYDRAAESPRRVLIPIGVLFLVLLGWVVAVRSTDLIASAFSRAGHAAGSGDAFVAAIRSAWSEGALTTLAFLGVTAVVVSLARRSPRLLPWVVLIAALELVRGNAGHMPLAPRALFEEPSALVKTVQASAQPGQPVPRVVSTGEAPAWGGGMLSDPYGLTRGLTGALKPDLASIYGIGVIGEAMLPALPERMLRIAAPSPSSWGRWLHACWRIEPLHASLPADEKVVVEDEDISTELVSQPCFSYAFIAGALPAVDAKDATRQIDAGLPRNMVVWEGGRTLAMPHAQAEVESFAPGRVVLSTETDGPAALVVSEGPSPGWSARIDGTPTAIFPTNLVAQGVELPPGRHKVELDYRIPRFWPGVLLSLLGLGLALSCVMVGGRRSPAD